MGATYITKISLIFYNQRNLVNQLKSVIQFDAVNNVQG